VTIAILAGGSESWNEFRRQHPECLVLNDTALPHAELAHADLHAVILMESDLRGANLACARLERAVLRKTDFCFSNLQEAVLDGADLFRTNLSGADLRNASLTSSFLKGANLCGTDLRGVDLSTAMGLTDSQLLQALGDDRTRLPDGIARPPTWMALNHVNGNGDHAAK